MNAVTRRLPRTLAHALPAAVDVRGVAAAHVPSPAAGRLGRRGGPVARTLLGGSVLVRRRSFFRPQRGHGL